MRFLKWLGTLAVEGVVSAILLAGISAVAGGVWLYWLVGPLSVYGGPAALIGGSLIFSSTLVAWDRLRAIDARAKQLRLSNRTSDELVTQIRDWFMRAGWMVGFQEKKEADFHIGATHKDFNVSVFRPKASAWVRIATRLDLDDEARALFSSTGNIAVFQDINLELLRMGVEHKIEHNDKASYFIVSTSTMVDAATTDLDFLQTVNLVQRGKQLVEVMLQRHADQIRRLPPPED